MLCSYQRLASWPADFYTRRISIAAEVPKWTPRSLKPWPRTAAYGQSVHPTYKSRVMNGLLKPQEKNTLIVAVLTQISCQP